MSIFGGNILKMAMRVVGSEQVIYLKFIRKENNAIGLDVSTYAEGKCINAQVQPVNRSVYQYLGLDFQKDYIKIYTEKLTHDLERDTEADRFMYHKDTYEALSNNAWKRPQGWNGVLAVKVS